MSSSPLDLEKICRICMQIQPDMILLFDEKYGDTDSNMNMADMITACSIYKVDRFDGLPHLICATCGADVKKAYRFKRNCEQTHRKLLDLLGKLHTVGTSQRTDAEKSTQTESTSVYPCERCDAKFFEYHSLRSHRDVHHKGSAMICRFCSKSFNRIGYLKTHIAIFHPEAGFTSHNQCYMCDKQFTRREHMRRHLAVKHKLVEVGPLADNALELKSAVAVGVGKHDLADADNSASSDDKNESLRYLEEMLLADDDTEGADDEMPKFRETNGKVGFVEVLLNENNMHGVDDGVIEAVEDVLSSAACVIDTHETPSIPQYCESETPASIEEPPVRSKTKRQLEAASVSPTNVGCRVCFKRFPSAVELTEHENATHTSCKVHKCDECADEFTHYTQYKRHMDLKHSRKQHACQICRKKFTTKMYLQRHLAIHERKRYVCKECSHSCMTKDELANHMKTNGHDKPLLCPECGLRCKTSNILTIHMRRHKGEKPFKCRFCSKGFPRLDDVRVHEKYHTNEKSHFCETCGKGFQRKYNLTIHRRVHTGEKPYKCPHCTQAFAQGNDLKAHIRRHTGERFACEICSATFLQGYQMRQHKLEQHGIKEIPPTQRVKKFTSPEEQEQQIKQNLQTEKDESDVKL